MTLEQLRIFVAVAEQQHLTRAAGRLNLTQSAVSAAVAALEARYGVALFDRIGRGIVLTEAGRAFLPEARAVLARAAAAEQVLLDTDAGLRGQLRLVASQTVGTYWIAGRMARFGAIYPGVDLHLDITNTELAAARVLSGEADIGIVEGQVGDPRLAVVALQGDSMQLVLPARHALAGRPLGPDDWAGLRFVVREAGSGTRAILEAHLVEMGLQLEASRIVLELPSNEAIRRAVEEGVGAAVLSSLVTDGAQGLHCRPLEPVVRWFSLIRMKERSPTRAETAFAAICAKAGGEG